MAGLHDLLIILLGAFAGLVGSVAGVGGAMITTPLLTLYFGVPIHEAIGASLAAVVTTSSATSSVYVSKHVADIRLGMVLELASTTGALVAAVIAGYLDHRTVAILFALFLVSTALALVRRAWQSRTRPLNPEIPAYEVRRYPLGLGASLGAGVLSGLLGVGGGPVKVPVMYLYMGVPLRVATATSNWMIGVTAAASAYIYWGRGDIQVAVAAPLVVGVFLGSVVGARLAPRVRSTYILWTLVLIAGYLAVRMLFQIAMGKVS